MDADDKEHLGWEIADGAIVPIKRGGPRPNSGRRPIDPALKRKPFSCTLAPETDEYVRAIWRVRPGNSLGEVIDLIVKELIGRDRST